MLSPFRMNALVLTCACYSLCITVHKCVKFNRFGEVLIKNILTQCVSVCTVHGTQQSSNSLGYDFSSVAFLPHTLARSLFIFVFVDI